MLALGSSAGGVLEKFDPESVNGQKNKSVPLELILHDVGEHVQVIVEVTNDDVHQAFGQVCAYLVDKNVQDLLCKMHSRETDCVLWSFLIAAEAAILTLNWTGK